MYTRTGVFILLLLTAWYSAADIYRCKTEDGKWLFTDRQCNKGAGQKVTLLPLVTIEKSAPVVLSEAERKALTDLDHKVAATRELRIRRLQRMVSQKRMNNKIKRNNCRRAKQQITGIQEKMRHGYKLSEARALDHRLRDLKAMKRANCR